MKTRQDTTLAVIVHLITYFTSFIGPLIIYFVSEDEFAKKNAATALNWQISFFIYSIVSVAIMLTIVGILIALPALLVLAALNFVFPIIAAIKANESVLWNYPLALPFIKVKS